MWRRYPATSWTAALTLLACSVALFAADRPARVITPEGSPIWLDPQRTLVFDAPSLTVMLRNEHSQPVSYALRLWVFDESTNLKGTQDFCSYDALGGHSRVMVVVPIAIAGVTLRDRTVVSVTAAVSGQASWSLREDARAQLQAALAAARGSTARLTFQREATRPGGCSAACTCDGTEIGVRKCGYTRNRNTWSEVRRLPIPDALFLAQLLERTT
jgi:hypothetical protein